MGLIPAIDKHPIEKSRYSVGSDVRVYAIGDIHGRLDLLDRIHVAIREDATAYRGRRVVVYLGDYVDRGPHSKEVLDRLVDDPLSDFECHYLKGNHECAFIDFLDNDPSVPTWAPKKRPVGLASWLLNGGGETLRSYGIDLADPEDKTVVADAMAALRNAVPVEHRSFLANLSLSHAEGDYRFVHAGIRPNVAWHDQSEHDLCWIREEFLLAAEEFGFCVVHGHTISEEPEIRRNRIGIDTGAVFSGRLTCLILEQDGLRIWQT